MNQGKLAAELFEALETEYQNKRDQQLD